MIGNKQEPRTFDKLSNPHTNAKANKANKIVSIKQEGMAKGSYENASRIVEIEKFDTVSSLCKDLLAKGLTSSFIDLFYIASAKTPDLKRKYKRHYDLEDPVIVSNSSKVDGNGIRKSYENLQEAEGRLLQAMSISIEPKEERVKKQKLQQTLLEESIALYGKIRGDFFPASENIANAIYFDHRKIEISTKYRLETARIRSFLALGNSLENTKVENDLKLSMKLKEDARGQYHNSEKDNTLNFDICNDLVNLYKNLAQAEEKVSNFGNAILYLEKQLVTLEEWREVSVDSNKTDGEQIGVYLKLANLYFQLGQFENTLNKLDTLNDFINNSKGEVLKNSNNYQIQCIYLSAQTYEKLGEYDKAIKELKKVDTSENKGSQATQDQMIIAKSFLNLGRLYFRQEDYKQAVTNLSTFFSQARGINNDLLDLARVNFGMVNGTQSFDDYVKLIKNSDYKDFLNQKLKITSDK